MRSASISICEPDDVQSQPRRLSSCYKILTPSNLNEELEGGEGGTLIQIWLAPGDKASSGNFPSRNTCLNRQGTSLFFDQLTCSD